LTSGTLSASSAGVTPNRASESLPVRSWPPILGYVGGAALGAILLFAAYAKAIDPAAFAEQIRVEGLAVLLSPFALALAGVALEVGLGVALILNLRTRTVLVAATALVIFFLVLTGRTYWRAAHGIAPPAANCGCFGNLVERTPAQAFWQDLLLLVPALACAWIGRPAAGVRGRRMRFAATGALAAGAAVFASAAPKLPLDDLATRLKPGVQLGEICSGRGAARVCLADLVPEIGKGRHWVVLVDPLAGGGDAFADVAKKLNAWALAAREPAVSALADLTAEQQNQIFWRYAPAFDIHETPAPLLRPLYRTLPRSFLVEDGRVVRTESGVAREIASAAASTTTSNAAPTSTPPGT
jgi:uncharacterized membrane protein YphA (DoxX/SURF4 family)